MECIVKISGTQDMLCRLMPESHEVLDEQIAEEVDHSAQGPLWFTYNGERLTDIRDRTER